jgi:hypothetical protein
MYKMTLHCIIYLRGKDFYDKIAPYVFQHLYISQEKIEVLKRLIEISNKMAKSSTFNRYLALGADLAEVVEEVERATLEDLETDDSYGRRFSRKFSIEEIYQMDEVYGRACEAFEATKDDWKEATYDVEDIFTAVLEEGHVSVNDGYCARQYLDAIELLHNRASFVQDLDIKELGIDRNIDTTTTLEEAISQYNTTE